MDVAESGIEEGLDGDECVRAWLDGADGEDELLGELVEVAHFGTLFVGGGLSKARSATLIDDVDAVFGEVAESEDVALGALGDSNDAQGFAQGGVELASIEEDVDGVIVFGVAQEDEVVYGDDSWDACAL